MHLQKRTRISVSKTCKVAFILSLGIDFRSLCSLFHALRGRHTLVIRFLQGNRENVQLCIFDFDWDLQFRVMYPYREPELVFGHVMEYIPLPSAEDMIYSHNALRLPPIPPLKVVSLDLCILVLIPRAPAQEMLIILARRAGGRSRKDPQRRDLP